MKKPFPATFFVEQKFIVTKLLGLSKTSFLRALTKSLLSLKFKHLDETGLRSCDGDSR